MSEEEKPAEKKTETRRIVFCGHDLAHSTRKEIARFHFVTSEGTLGDTLSYAGGKWTKKLSVGAVYEAQFEATQIYPGTVRYQSTWPDHPQVAAWRVVDRATEVEKSARKRKEKDANEALNRLKAYMEPLREEYQVTNSLGRLAIETVLLSYLRS